MSDNWVRVREILFQVLELSPANRQLALDEIYREDPAIRPEVESYIKAYDDAPSLLEKAALRQSIFDEKTEILAPATLIGVYRIVHEIGHGGMGTVYLAERADGQFDKKVALKLIRPGQVGREIFQRFLKERQTLARLNHPNIAQLLDGGITGQGLPYYVMQYIEGQPLDTYCDRQRLDTNERLLLLQKICGAVQYLHQNLIVHRDLKPANILVTSAGEPVLLDFGIAKILATSEASSETQTQTGVWLLTPDFASPEQMRQQMISTASDIYSLGVLLYRLLTGVPPYRLQHLSPQEMERVVCEVDPPRPSAVVTLKTAEAAIKSVPSSHIYPDQISKYRQTTPEKLQRRLRGDLDFITLKALRKEPDQRYISVEQFSADIRHHLNGMPVIARQGTWSYRSQKFVRRHRVSLVVVFLFLTLVLGFSVNTFRQSVKIRQERDKAKQVSQLLIDFFKVSDPKIVRGDTITAREFLEQGAFRIEPELASQPEIQAEMQDVIGRVYQSLGLYDQAETFLKKALDKRIEQFGNQHPEVAKSLISQGLWFLEKGNYSAAESLFQVGLDIQEDAFGANSVEVAECLSHLGGVQNLKSDQDQAEVSLVRALAIFKKQLGEENLQVADCYHKLGSVLHNRREADQAESFYHRALRIRRTILGDIHPQIASSLNQLSALEISRRNFTEAEKIQREVLEIQEKIYGEDHPEVARALTSIGNLVLLYDAKSAGQLFERGLKIIEKRPGKFHPWYSTVLNIYATIAWKQNDFQKCENLYRETVEIRNKITDVPPGHRFQSLNNLGWALYHQNKLGEAETVFKNALELKNKVGAIPEHYLASFFNGYGQVLTETGRLKTAETMLRNAIVIWETKFGGTGLRNAGIRDSRSALGACLTAQKRFVEAESLLVLTFPEMKNYCDPNHKHTHDYLKRIIHLYEDWGQPEKSAEYRKILEETAATELTAKESQYAF